MPGVCLLAPYFAQLIIAKQPIKREHGTTGLCSVGLAIKSTLSFHVIRTALIAPEWWPRTAIRILAFVFGFYVYFYFHFTLSHFLHFVSFVFYFSCRFNSFSFIFRLNENSNQIKVKKKQVKKFLT